MVYFRESLSESTLVQFELSFSTQGDVFAETAIVMYVRDQVSSAGWQLHTTSYGSIGVKTLTYNIDHLKDNDVRNGKQLILFF